MRVLPFSYLEQLDNIVPPAPTPTPIIYDSVYITGYNFYQYNGNRLGLTTGGGVAKVGFDGILDVDWKNNANPSGTTEVRFGVFNRGIFYGDYREGSNRRFKTLDTDGNATNTITTSGGSVWNVNPMEDTDGILITGNLGINWGSYGTIPSFAKVNTDLTFDTAFNTNLGSGASFSRGVVKSSTNYAVIHNDTDWGASNGGDSQYLVVLNLDGSVDTNFVRGGNTFNSTLRDALFIDNKLIAVGPFTTYGGVTRNRLVCFNLDGSVDTTFHSNSGTQANDYIIQIEKVTETTFMLVGNFTSWNGTSAKQMVIVDTSGNLISANINSGFNVTPAKAIYNPNTTKSYFAGSPSFSSYNGTGANNIIGLNSDYSIDTNFVYGTGMRTSSGGVAEVGNLSFGYPM